MVADIKVDNKQVSAGDQLRIVATVRNDGIDTVYLEIHPDPYAVAHVKVSDAGIQLPSYFTVIFELAPPQKSDFAKLGPGDEISMVFKGVMRRMTIRDIRNQMELKLRDCSWISALQPFCCQEKAATNLGSN